MTTGQLQFLSGRLEACGNLISSWALISKKSNQAKEG